jgi:cysteinyl-tRNA synthetase
MKRLSLYDTLTRERQDVFPSDGEVFRFYCCGPTVYGPAHIGNFRTFLVQDLLRRVVELSGLKTRHVRNVTDVDDKTIRESQAAGIALPEFAAGWTARFHEDADALNTLPPHVEPGAVDHIPEQIDLIENLLSKGNAYHSEDGSVYFKVSSYAPYGRLSRLDKRELKAGAAESANDADEYDKDNASDFVLWKTRKPADGENFWESPWGEGRPGWHLECSAMGMKYLGESFDLHAGGVDLCFPHHENEIAQSEAATGKSFARHWFHNEHLMVDGRKMSKSLGNLYTLSDIIERGFGPGELRYALLAGSCHTKINFSLARLQEASGNLQRISRFVAALGDGLPDYGELCLRAASGGLELGPFVPVWDALLEDLNTPAALGQLFTALKPLEKAVVAGSLNAGEADAARTGLAVIVHAFGWIIPKPAEEGENAGEAPPEIAQMAQQRWAAKQDKNWAEADRLRDALAAAGWMIKDSAEGYKVEPNRN